MDVDLQAIRLRRLRGRVDFEEIQRLSAAVGELDPLGAAHGWVVHDLERLVHRLLQ